MLLARILLSATLLGSMFGLAMAKQLNNADSLRAQAEQICFDDVQRLCGDFIPDEDRIKVCMKQKRSALSPACRKIFDQGI